MRSKKKFFLKNSLKQPLVVLLIGLDLKTNRIRSTFFSVYGVEPSWYTVQKIMLVGGF